MSALIARSGGRNAAVAGRAGILLLACILAALPLPAQSVREVFQRVSGSVVVVHVKETTPGPAPGQLLAAEGLGSGVLIDPAGKVLTAAHVVQAANEVTVEFPSGEILKAKVVASAPRADVSLLQLERPPASPVAVPLGNSDRAEVGDEIFIVGAPLGISHTLTVGHISAKRRAASFYGSFFPAELLQTDAAINQGNSGGPMFNMQGEVIGVVSHMISPTGSYAGLGFAVASNTVTQLLLDRPTLWTGIDGYLVKPAMARLLNLPFAGGLLVQRVAEGSPAARMGLRAGSVQANIGGEELLLGGDVIIAVDGIVVEPGNFPRLQERLKQGAPGRRIALTIIRGGERTVLTSDPLP